MIMYITRLLNNYISFRRFTARAVASEINKNKKLLIIACKKCMSIFIGFRTVSLTQWMVHLSEGENAKVSPVIRTNEENTETE